MTAPTWTRRLQSGFAQRLAQLAKDRRGIAAVEFAIIVPLLLAMYFVTLEAGQGLDTNKKLGRVASIVADLVTQEPAVVKDDLNAILQIGSAILQPYSRSKPSIYIAGIQLDGANPPTATVKWYRSLINGATGKVEPSPQPVIPTSLKIPNTFLVRVYTTLDYKPVIAWSATDKSGLGFTSPFTGIKMEETYYLRARNGPTVECSDC
ncbi:MAG: TadE/TadG family type IV pilus assembly protein [Rhizobiaceae bacterium]